MSKPKSRHNLSHHRMLTYPMGYSVPTLIRLLCPADEVDISATDVIRLDPFQYTVMDTLHVVSSTYFVPLHQLYEGFERFITGLVTDSPNSVVADRLKAIMDILPWMPYGYNFSGPEFGLSAAQFNYFREGWTSGTGLFSYLNIPPPRTIENDGTILFPQIATKASECYRLNALAFLAYHKIVDDYFRDEEMEYQSVDWPLDYEKHTVPASDQYYDQPALLTNLMINPAYWRSVRPWQGLPPSNVGWDIHTDNGFHMRRANWEPDYLTTRRPKPQRGEAENITVGPDGLFSVDELREATAIQNYKLAQQRSGGRLDDFYKKFYGVDNANCTFGKCDQIGHETMGLEISDVPQTSESGETPQGHTVGYSKTVGQGDSLKFTAKCFGILMRLTRVLPRTTYHYSIDPLHTLMTQFDFFQERLENIGWQPVPRSHVACFDNGSDGNNNPSAALLSQVTGWQPPYEYFRRQLSYTAGGFNPLNQVTPVYEWTFARDFLYGGNLPLNYFDGSINPAFRKADPTNWPFADSNDSPTQVQHYVDYRFHVNSVVPHAINNRDLLH